MKQKLTLEETIQALNMTMPAQTGETPVPKNKPAYADVYYTEAKDERQSLDIYLPRQSDGPAPVIVYIHGGAWTVGSKADVQQNSYDVHVLADNLLNSGYAIAPVNYRLMPQYRYPAQTDDVVAAVKFLYDHAAEYGLDASRMAIMGESAGGFLTEFAATTLGTDYLRACVAFYSPSDLATLSEQNDVEHGGKDVNFMDILSAAMPGVLPDGEKMEEMLLQERIGTEAFREKAKAVSPAYRVSDRTPPTLLLHGTGDKVIAYAQSVSYLERLQAAAVPCELVTMEGANHMEPCLFNSSEYTEEIINFLNTFMNPAL